MVMLLPLAAGMNTCAIWNMDKTALTAAAPQIRNIFGFLGLIFIAKSINIQSIEMPQFCSLHPQCTFYDNLFSP
jgi:hypothetical protein